MNKKYILWIAVIFMILLFGKASYAKETQGLYLEIDKVEFDNDKIQFDINDVRTGTEITKEIMLDLEYKSGTSYDVNNDGIENVNGIIDFSVKNSVFIGDVNLDNLCTRWEITSLDSHKSKVVCYGNEKCCNFVSLTPSSEKWDDDFYLYYGAFGSTNNNSVRAQVMHVDYSLDEEDPYSEIFYSKWKSLNARFTEIKPKEEESQDANKKAVQDKEIRSFDSSAIKNNNPSINNIELRDKKGNEINDLRENKKADLVFSISRNKKIMASSEQEIVVEIKDFNISRANWENSKNIIINEADDTIKRDLQNRNIEVKKSVKIENVDGFLNDDEYRGYIAIKFEEEFNKVIYCPDDILFSCVRLEICKNSLDNCYLREGDIIKAYLPHFSTIIIGIGNTSIKVNITSPDNSSSLDLGEDVYFNFTSNETLYAFYSIDNSETYNLSQGTSFSTILNTTTEFDLLYNGLHNITLLLFNQFEDNKTINYIFRVNDSIAPELNLNITNKSSISAKNFEYPLKITSNEYCNISYKLNNKSNSSWTSIGENKNHEFNISPINGQNILLINSIDMHGNARVHNFVFNFTETGNCSDARQNGDETGIDCGGSCGTCINLSISTNKQEYNLTDNVYVTVTSRANSYVELIVTKEGKISYKHNFTPVFGGAPISETRLIQNTSNAGNYTISALMHYINITESKNSVFEVVSAQNNPLSVTINANQTTIDEGSAVRFSATVSGNTGTLTYKWDFNNDGTIDSTLPAPNKTFDTNATYTVNLTVFDSQWNQTDFEIINVKKLYNITIIVKDNSTNNLIQAANIEFNDMLKNSSSQGKAIFTRHEGNFNLVITKSGYKAYSKDIDLRKSFTFYANLTPSDESAPKVSLISPEQDSTISSQTATFRYYAVDSSDMTCKLYLAEEDSSFWQIKDTNNTVSSNIESILYADKLSNGTYEWKIECIDREGNSNSSEVRRFMVDTFSQQLSVDLDEQDKDTEDTISQINQIIEKTKSLTGKEKDIADAIELKKMLEKAITTIQRGNRDLHSLKWRRLNDTELEIETKKILDSMENVKYTTPKSFKVIETSEFVKYPDKEDIRKLISTLINDTNLKLNKREINSLVDKNDKLQSIITVTTEAANVDIEYIAGNKETITVIKKSIKTEEETTGKIFYEIIPKEIVSDINNTVALFDYEIIQKDPIISIDIENMKEFTYFIREKIDLKEIENIKSILIDKELKPEKRSFITGFAIFDNFTSNLINETDIRLVIEIIIIIILAAIYLMYTFGGFERLHSLIESKDVKEIENMIRAANKFVIENDYNNASAKYKEINHKFKSMAAKDKEHVKEDVIDLINKVNFLFINKLAKEANENIESNRKKALENYKKIQSLYKIVPKVYKSQVLEKCTELHNRLSNKN